MDFDAGSFDWGLDSMARGLSGLRADVMKPTPSRPAGRFTGRFAGRFTGRFTGLFTGLWATTAVAAPGRTEVALVAGTLPVGVGVQVSHRRPDGWMGEAGLGTALFIHSGHLAAGYGWAPVEGPGFRLEVPLLATAGAFLADGDDWRPLAGALTGLQLLWPGAHLALGLRLGAVQVWSGGEDQSGVNPVAELGLGITF